MVSSLSVRAQLLVLRDVNGRPIPVNQYVNVTGSPYLYDTWVKGSVNFANGSNIIDVDLKYDQVEGNLYFKKDNETILTFSDPIKEFILTDITDPLKVKNYINGVYIAPGKAEPGFYEVLINDQVKLLKRTKKTITESKEYSSATINKSISKSETFYIFKDGQIINAKKDKKFIANTFPEKAKELDEYSKKNKLNLKEEVALVKLVTHYNSLIK